MKKSSFCSKSANEELSSVFREKQDALGLFLAIKLTLRIRHKNRRVSGGVFYVKRGKMLKFSPQINIFFEKIIKCFSIIVKQKVKRFWKAE